MKFFPRAINVWLASPNGQLDAFFRRHRRGLVESQQSVSGGRIRRRFHHHLRLGFAQLVGAQLQRLHSIFLFHRRVAAVFADRGERQGLGVHLVPIGGGHQRHNEGFFLGRAEEG